MSRPRQRSVIGMLVSLALVLPSAAVAAPPDKGTETSLSFNCDTAGPDGTSLFVEAGDSSRFGSFGFVVVWTGGADPLVDPPTFISDSEAPAEVTVEGTTITAVMPLVLAETSEAVGTATVVAELTGTGNIETIDERSDFGNAFERFSGTIEEATVSGLATIDLTVGDDLAFELAGCLGGIANIKFFSTSPTGRVNSGSGTFVDCFWETDLGAVFLNAGLFEDGFSFASVFIDPLLVSGNADGVDLSVAGLSAEVSLVNEVTGEPLPNPGSIEASFTFDHKEVIQIKRDRGFERVWLDVYAVVGSLSIPDLGLELDMGDCLAWTERFHAKGGSSEGPKGKPAVNDTLDGALPIEVGTTIRSNNIGTAFDAEVEASCAPVHEIFGVQFGHTLWYELIGTGGEVTIDTAASHFDTVLAVYEVGEELTEVACVDDVPTGDISRTTSAMVTFDTVEGAIYVVQLGGFAGEADRFVLTVR